MENKKCVWYWAYRDKNSTSGDKMRQNNDVPCKECNGITKPYNCKSTMIYIAKPQNFEAQE